MLDTNILTANCSHEEMRNAMTGSTLIQGGRVYDHEGDTDQPPYADVLIDADRISAIGKPGTLAAGPGARVIDARERMVMPGFVSAHYHSHDVLHRGVFEPEPLDYWLMTATPPSYPPRSLEELRVRTLLGAIDCLRGGITTIQDMATIASPIRYGSSNPRSTPSRRTAATPCCAPPPT